MRVCSSCGRENPMDRDFCECGEYLRWEPTGYMPAISADQAAEAAPPAGQPPVPGDPAQQQWQQPPAPTAGHPQAAQQPPAAAQQPPAAPPPPPVSPQPTAPQPPAAPLAHQPHAPAAPPAVPAPPPPGNGAPRTAIYGSVGAAPPAADAAAPPAFAQHAQEVPELASITLRLPDGEALKGEVLALAAEPGQWTRVVAMVRNTSQIVDNYELSIQGIPADWYTIAPNTVYLVPFGSGGSYEQEVDIQLHPPKSPEAQARIWDLSLIAVSRAHNIVAAQAPMGMAIEPFTDYEQRVKPERVSGRKRGRYDVVVKNKANAPVLVALGLNDPDSELRYEYHEPQLDLQPGEERATKLTVRPPRRIWIGRPYERRFDVLAKTGEEGEALLASQPLGEGEIEKAELAKSGGRRKRPKGWWKRKIPFYGPRLYRPRMMQPNLYIGPGGVQIRKPMMTGGQMGGGQMRGMHFNLNQLTRKVKGPAISKGKTVDGPLLPTQAVYRQKSYLPWWVAVVVPLLVLLAILLFMLLPKNAVVPELTGKEVFAAEEALTEAKLKLSPNQKEKVDTEAKPGTVISQTPKPGEEVEEGTEITVQVAISPDTVEVPELEGETFADAEKALREAELTKGQVDPVDAKPDFIVKSSLPGAKEVVNKGKPVDLFLISPAQAKREAEGGGGGGGAGGAGGGGGAGPADITVPAIGSNDVEAYAQLLADLKLVPQSVRAFDDKAKAGELFATDPPGGTKVAEGATVQLLVSAGFPLIAFDNSKNILLVNGANGKRLPAIAKGPAREKDPAFTFSGSHVAYVSVSGQDAGGRLYLANREKPDQPPLPISREGEQFLDPAFAPTADANVLATNKVVGQDENDLCIGAVTRDGYSPQCISDPSFSTARAIRWAPNGKAIYVFAVREVGTFGIVQYKSDKPFSTDAADWGKGRFVTDNATGGKGAIDLSLSPDGKRMVVVANFESDDFQLYLTKPNDFSLGAAKLLQIQGCKADWRADSRELVVVQGDCRASVANIVRVNPFDNRVVPLRTNGDNPVFQPILPETTG